MRAESSCLAASPAGASDFGGEGTETQAPRISRGCVNSPTRDTPARTSVPRIVDDNGLFTRTHRSYYLQNRANMYATWDYRRAREGARNYKGGMVWHEGVITFKRDCTLEGGVPIMLFYCTDGRMTGRECLWRIRHQYCHQSP